MANPSSEILLTLSLIFSLLASVCAGTNVLYSGGKLATNERLVYKQYALIMQGDCNLVVYDGSSNPIWASGTYHRGHHCYLTLDSKGSLTIYTPSHGRPFPVWSSNTTSSEGSYALVLQYDGSLRVYGPTMWSSVSLSPAPVARKAVSSGGSYPVTTDSVLYSGDVATIGTIIVNTGYALVLEGGCNLVLNNTVSGAVVWETGSSDWLHDCFINLEATGEFKIKYMGGETLWTNGVKSGYGEYVLILRPDGKLVLYGPAIWAGKKSGSVAVAPGSVEAGEKIAMVTAE